jgi:hypothetical protein
MVIAGKVINTLPSVKSSMNSLAGKIKTPKIDIETAVLLAAAIANGAACVYSDGTSPGYSSDPATATPCSGNACTCAAICLGMALARENNNDNDKSYQTPADQNAQLEQVTNDPKFANLINQPGIQAEVKNKLIDMEVYKPSLEEPAYFDYKWYTQVYVDLAQFRYDPEAAIGHFNDYGIREGRCGSPDFCSMDYLDLYSDLKAAFGTDYKEAYQHYKVFGLKECRCGSNSFCPKSYLDRYPDLSAAFGSDCLAAYNHWIAAGKKEGRYAGP